MRFDSPLAVGLAALGTALGDPFVQARVRRAEFDKDDRLWLDLDDDTAWYRVDLRTDAPAVMRCEAYEDDRLPLARWVESRRSDPLLEVLAWRPGRRLVVAHVDGEHAAVRKGHRRSRLTLAVQRHEAAVAINGADGFRVPSLRRVCEQTASVEMELLVGLEPRLQRENAADFTAIGRALAHMQSSALPADFGVHGPAEELAVVDGAGAKLARATGVVLDCWTQVRERLVELTPTTELDPVPCHRDLHDRQFIFGADRPGLLDFDSLCSGDAALDPANLLAHLALRRLQGLANADADGVRACSEALVQGLERERDTTFYARLRFYQATALLRLAAVYAIRPRWSHLGRDLVRLAWRCADDSPVARP